MIRISNIKVPLNKSLEDILKRKYGVTLFKINKKSIDARDKNNIYYVYQVDVNVKNEKKYLKFKNIIKTPKEEYTFPKLGNEKLKNRPVIVGSGPAGLFCAYFLALKKYNPIIIERGKKIEDRLKDVNEFWETGKLNNNSNVQFGEGGAGTFSDGKLNTLVKDKNFRMKKIFEIFVENGAPSEIMYDYKPHIGTDRLQKIIPNIREKIISMGGDFFYESCLNDIIVKDNKLVKIVVNDKEIDCDILILAIGHSARDTFNMLYKRNINMVSKNFAVGVRVQHLQKNINKAQYGNNLLPPASYKLTYHSKKNRGVYSFCMCPGGYVVNSSSSDNLLSINGMSNYDRESDNANSAIVVTVSSLDFGNHPLDGVRFQEKLESKAYKIGCGKIPIQLYKDYKLNKKSNNFNSVKPIFKGNYSFGNLNDIFPDYINESLKEGIEYFGTKINGFNNDDIILAGVESRTSSPVRILRDENLVSNIDGIYPCGEGAGYSGGIITSAMDGIKVAEKIGSKYFSFKNVK